MSSEDLELVGGNSSSFMVAFVQIQYLGVEIYEVFH